MTEKEPQKPKWDPWVTLCNVYVLKAVYPGMYQIGLKVETEHL